MKGPFFLPESINEGDFIELEGMGAYSVTMKIILMVLFKS